MNRSLRRLAFVSCVFALLLLVCLQLFSEDMIEYLVVNKLFSIYGFICTVLVGTLDKEPTGYVFSELDRITIKNAVYRTGPDWIPFFKINLG